MSILRIELLPDDVARLIFNEWLSGTDDLTLISRLDRALNRSARDWFLAFVRNRGVKIRYRLSNSQAIQWIIARSLQVRSIDFNIEVSSLPAMQSICSDASVLASLESIAVTSYGVVEGDESWELTGEFLRNVLAASGKVQAAVFKLSHSNLAQCIPWDMVRQQTKLQRISVALPSSNRPGYIPLQFFGSASPQPFLISQLSLSGARIAWGEFETLLTHCPRLESLSLHSITLLSLPRQDKWFAQDVPKLNHIKNLELSTLNSSIRVGEYLLHHCSQVESVAMDISSNLLSLLFSPAITTLRSVELKFVETRLTFERPQSVWISAQSAVPFQLDWPPLPGYTSGLAQWELQTAMGLLTVADTVELRVEDDDEFFSSYPETLDLPLKKVTLSSSANWGGVVEWMHIFTLSELQHLTIYTSSYMASYSLHENTLDSCALLVGIHYMPRSPGLTHFTCVGMDLSLLLPQFARLMPYLTTIELDDCTLTFSDLSACFKNFPELSSMTVKQCRSPTSADHLADVSFDFSGVDFTGRPRVDLVMNGGVLSTWPLVESLVLGLGSNLKRLEIIDLSPTCELRQQRNVEFLARNRHVVVRY